MTAFKPSRQRGREANLLISTSWMRRQARSAQAALPYEHDVRMANESMNYRCMHRVVGVGDMHRIDIWRRIGLA